MATRLLDAVRVLDLSGGVTDTVTRLLADLGADVLKVEPPGGSPERHVLPTLAGVSIPFAVHNANKRSAMLNPLDGDDRRRSSTSSGEPTSSSTAALASRPPRSGRRVPNSPIAMNT